MPRRKKALSLLPPEPKPKGPTEHGEQMAVFEWRDRLIGRHPELGCMYAVPNGAKLPYRRGKGGVRYSPEARRLIEEGLTPGIPDICLAIPKSGFGALYIEMKVGDGKTSEKQDEKIALLRAVGNKVVTCWSSEAAIREIEEYLDLPSESRSQFFS